MSGRLALRFCHFLSVVLIVMGVTETTAAVSTTATVDLFKSERALIQLFEQPQKDDLNANRELVGQMLAAFEEHMAVCRTAGRRVSWNMVEAFRKAAKRYRAAPLHRRDLLVRWYDRILEARPDHRDAFEIEYDAAHQFDIDCLHWTDEKASPTEAIRRYQKIVEKYPLTLGVYQAHLRIANLAEFTKQIELAKRHLELMIGTEFEDIRGPRPMTRAQWRERYGASLSDTLLDRKGTLESMKERFNGYRHAARRILVFWCIQSRSKTVDEMKAEFDRLRAKFPEDKFLAGVTEHALKEGPKGAIRKTGR